MFLKLHGVTGEASDTEHKGEIDVVSWSWGMQANSSLATGIASAERPIPKCCSRASIDVNS